VGCSLNNPLPDIKQMLNKDFEFSIFFNLDFSLFIPYQPPRFFIIKQHLNPCGKIHVSVL